MRDREHNGGCPRYQSIRRMDSEEKVGGSSARVCSDQGLVNCVENTARTNAGNRKIADILTPMLEELIENKQTIQVGTRNLTVISIDQKRYQVLLSDGHNYSVHAECFKSLLPKE